MNFNISPLYSTNKTRLAYSKIRKKILRNFRKMISQLFDNKISIFLKLPTYCSFILLSFV